MPVFPRSRSGPTRRSPSREGGRGSFVRTKDAYQLYAAVKESGFEKAAEALLAEAERISRFGFTQTELDRQRANLLRSD